MCDGEEVEVLVWAGRLGCYERFEEGDLRGERPVGCVGGAWGRGWRECAG